MVRRVRLLACASRLAMALGMATAFAGWSGDPAQAQSADVVRDIRVEGNQRIEPETIRSYMRIDVGDPFQADRIDLSLKSLFATGLFADVSIRQDGNALVVNVVENPIINRLAFEGNKAVKDDKLMEEAQLRPRVVYTRARVRSDVQRIIEIYRRSGRFAATVEPKIVQLDQNRVDLIFEIHEGQKSGIRRISFLGNKRFSDGDLRDVVSMRETRWWRFLTSADTYDPDRLTYDRELLREWYLKRGYADFRVVSAVAELTKDRKDFFITYTVEEGELYDFGEINVESQIKDLKVEDLEPLVLAKSGRRYNAEQIEKTVDALTDAAGELGYAFIDIRPRVRREKDARRINITFVVEETPRVYVERINITGNFRTLDRVIRREFRLVEGDAFNVARMRRSRERIKGLGFFGDVEVDQAQGTMEDRAVINVSVQEKSTGELSIGAGFSSRENFIGEVSIRERNLLGKGQDLRLAVSMSSLRQQIDLGFTEPYFLGRDIAAGVDIFHTRTDYQDYSIYDQQSTGFRLRSGFPITEYLYFSTRYTLRRDVIEILPGFDDLVSDYLSEAAGSFTTSSVGHSIGYDVRDDKIDPTRGFRVILSQDFAGVGGNVKYLRTDLYYDYYIPIFRERWVLSLTLKEGYIFGLNQDVRINDRYFLGGTTLRGFEPGGVGPRDVVNDYALGGNLYYSGSLEYTVPIGATSELGLEASVFVDFGSLTFVDVEGPNVVDRGSMRASAGIGIGWDSPFGPIRLDFAKAFLKEPYDQTQFFQFNFGTRF